MLARVIRVEDHEHCFPAPDERTYHPDDFRRRRTALHQGDVGAKLVTLEGDAIVRTDFDIDAYDSPMPHRLAQTRVEDERTSMSDASLDDHVRTQPINDLLCPDHVLGN